MNRTFAVALRATAVTLVLTGLIYPVAMTGAAQVLFRRAANGNLVTDEKGNVVGSRLIGQGFHAPAAEGRPWKYPGAGDGYDATSSGGSNLGPTSQKLHDRMTADATRLLQENPHAPGPIPVELLSASGSGLDPHVSPAAAAWQIPRVAAARHVEEARVRSVVEAETEGRDWGLFGEPTVNVLTLNLALDRQFGRLALDAKPGAISGTTPIGPDARN